MMPMRDMKPNSNESGMERRVMANQPFSRMPISCLDLASVVETVVAYRNDWIPRSVY